MLLLRNLMSMTAMRVVSALATLALVVSISRLWGVVPLGQFALLLTLFLFLQLMPLLGLHLHLVREVAARPASAAALGPNATAVGLVCATLLALALGFGGGSIYRDAPALALPLWLVAAALVPSAPIAVIEALLTGQQRMGVVARVNVGESLARSALSLLVVYAGGGLEAIFTVFLLARIGALVAYVRRSDVPSLFAWQELRAPRVAGLLRQAPAYLAILLCAALFMRMDMLSLSRLSSGTELGLYAAPARLYELGLMGPQIITVVLYPRLAALQHQRPADAAALLAGGVAAPLLIGLPVLLLLGWHAGFALSVFGPQFVVAAPVLGLLLVALGVAGLNQLLGSMMLALDRPDLDLRALLFTLAAQLPLLWLAVPAFGALGAAAVVAMSMLFMCGVRLVLLRRHIDLHPMLAALAWVLAPAAAMAFALIALVDRDPWLASAAALFLYAAAAALGLRWRAAQWRTVRRLFVDAKVASTPT